MRIVLPAVAVVVALALPACANRAPEPAAHPSTTTAAAVPAAKMGGCKDFYLYAANDDATQVLIVDVDAKYVGLEKGQRKTFDLSTPPKGVRVWLDVYLQPASVERVHCTKHPTEAQMAERYTPTSGTLTVELGADGIANATVEGVKFALEGRPAIELTTRRFDKIRVGWLPG